MSKRTETRLLETLWTATLGEGPMPVDIEGAPYPFDSPYDVSALSTACIATCAATLAEYAKLVHGKAAGASQGEQVRGRVHRSHAGAAFISERLLTPLQGELPAVWDPLSGNYETRDGVVRLHTNYEHHRSAALRALALEGDASADAVASACRERGSEELEAAVVAAGGCAAALRSRAQWLASEAGEAISSTPLVDFRCAEDPSPGSTQSTSPRAHGGILDGLRVLDLTRVIAGPLCTRTLAAHGAQVLRIDPPAFAEVPLLLAEVTMGKRCAALDLRSSEGKARFAELIRAADVLVVGLRSDALERLGLGLAVLRAKNPRLIVAELNAYGHAGPFRTRRGFDSLLQLSCGLSHTAMMLRGADRPVALPAQALDHGTGYLLAAAIIRALIRRAQGRGVYHIQTSLAAMAEVLAGALDEQKPLNAADQAMPAAERGTVATASAPFMSAAAPSPFGPVRHVAPAVRVPGFPVRYRSPACALATSPASFD